MKIIIIISTTLSILLTGCYTAAPVVKLWPKTEDKKDYWNMGQQFVCDENKKVSYECAFKRVELGKVIYNVKITNFSDTAILVAPEQFWQTVYKNDSLVMATDQADNPEQVLLNLELEGSRAHAASKNALATGIVTGVVTGGAMIAVATSDKDVETKTSAVNTIGDVGSVVVGSSLMTSDESKANVAENYANHDQLSNSYLRKTTLPPGYYIDGEIRLPYHENARWYCLQLGIANSGVVFYFRQILFYPAEYGTSR
jgi:hypothetical protein